MMRQSNYNKYFNEAKKIYRDHKKIIKTLHMLNDVKYLGPWVDPNLDEAISKLNKFAEYLEKLYENTLRKAVEEKCLDMIEDEIRKQIGGENNEGVPH